MQVCKLIHQAFIDGRPTIVVRMGPNPHLQNPYIIDLQHMVQVKVSNGYQRRIRFEVDGEGDPPEHPLHQPAGFDPTKPPKKKPTTPPIGFELESAFGGGSGRRKKAATAKEINKRAVYHPLYVLLMNAGWSVLVFDAATSSDGSAAAGQLHALFTHLQSHRSFRYCQVLLMTEGHASSAVFRALAEAPDVYASQLKAICASQPAAFDDADATDTLLSKYVPACRVPVLVALSKRSMGKAKYMARFIHAALRPELKLIAINRDLYWVDSSYPLYGRDRTLRIPSYFASHPDQLMHFMDTATRRRKKPKRLPARLKLWNLAAYEIPRADFNGVNDTSDPYLSFRVWIDGKHVASATTAPIMNAKECEWGDDCVLMMEVPWEWRKGRIEVILYDDDVSKADEVLGKADVTIVNEAGRDAGTVDRLRLRGVGDFHDSFASFMWEYEDSTPDTMMRWKREKMKFDITSSTEMDIGQSLSLLGHFQK